MRAAALELPDGPIECTWCSPWQCVADAKRATASTRLSSEFVAARHVEDAKFASFWLQRLRSRC